MAGLREMWDESLPEALRDALTARYGDKRRNAYRERYAEIVLTAVDALDQLATDPTAVRLAAWYHRAVHERGAKPAEDAEASAQLAEQELPTYDVSPARTAEVARLVRLTGGTGEEKTPDPNGDVLRDAVNAILADKNYVNHASEVRRDAYRLEDASSGWVERRYDDVRQLLDTRIYRTELAQDRYDADARANLKAELNALDALIPAPWRSWQRGALVVTAVLTAFVAFMAAFGATKSHWREPAYSGDSSWPAIVMTLLALGAVPALYWASRRTSRIVPSVAAVIGVLGLVFVWVRAPATNASSGIGQAVPLMVIVSILLILGGVAAFGATRFTARPRNRGQVLAGLAAAVVIAVLTVFVIDPLQTAYLRNANEHLEGQHQPADLNVRSQLTGGILWTGDTSGLSDLVATSHGIAVARAAGTVEMLDPATGRVRWRYIRTDTTDEPNLTVLNGGQQLLVSYDDLGYFVLDADTGTRLKAWPGRTKDYDIQNDDPLVTGLAVSKGSDKLYGTNVDGSNRWTYEPGRCTSIDATAVADTVVVDLGRTCGEADEVLGLNLKDGKKLWSHPGPLLNWHVRAGGLIIGPENGTSNPVEGVSTLVGLEPRSGEVKWRRPMPKQWGCTPRGEAAGDLVVLISCPNGEAAHTHTIVAAIDGASGRPVWTATAALSRDHRYAVTSDGRVVFMDDEVASCRLVEVSDGRASYRQLQKPINCYGGIAAAGNLVLVGTGDDSTITALR